MTARADERHRAPAIWAFVVADCFSFAMLFGVFMFDRRKDAKAFGSAASQLDLSLGLINTLLLLTSGWLLALATNAARHCEMAICRKLLLAALVVGLGFGGVKIAEYSIEIGAGVSPLSGGFFLYYYLLTGLHFLHYLAGLIVLAVLISRGSRSEAGTAEYHGLLESGALYWHLVDVLWLLIFPIIYLQVHP